MYADTAIVVAMISFGFMALALTIAMFVNVNRNNVLALFFGSLLFGVLGAISMTHYLGEQNYARDVPADGIGFDGVYWGHLPTWLYVAFFVVAGFLLVAAGLVRFIQILPTIASARDLFAFGKTQRQIESLDRAPATSDSSQIHR